MKKVVLQLNGLMKMYGRYEKDNLVSILSYFLHMFLHIICKLKIYCNYNIGDGLTKNNLSFQNCVQNSAIGAMNDQNVYQL